MKKKYKIYLSRGECEFILNQIKDKDGRATKHIKQTLKPKFFWLFQEGIIAPLTKNDIQHIKRKLENLKYVILRYDTHLDNPEKAEKYWVVVGILEKLNKVRW